MSVDHAKLWGSIYGFAESFTQLLRQIRSSRLATCHNVHISRTAPGPSHVMTSEISALRLEVSRLENENEDIRRERDRFAAQLVKFRQDNGTLESQIQDLGIENNDLKRKLARNEVMLSAFSVSSRG